MLKLKHFTGESRLMRTSWLEDNYDTLLAIVFGVILAVAIYQLF